MDDVTVHTTDIHSMTIEWIMRDPSSILADYEVDIYRSESPTEYDATSPIITGVPLVTGVYVDNNLENMAISSNRIIYYWLVIKHSVNLTEEINGPYYMRTFPDYATLEIIRRKNLVLTNTRYNARSFAVLKLRTWGDYCPICFDVTTQRVQNDNCPTCYGTGIDGGYFDPTLIRGFKTDKPNQFQVNLFGKWEDSNSMFVLQNFPLLIPGDFLIDELNERYLIESPVNHTEKGMYIIEQQVRAKTLSKTHPIYNYELDVALSELFPLFGDTEGAILL